MANSNDLFTAGNIETQDPIYTANVLFGNN